MTIKDPTPHELEALRIASDLEGAGCWAAPRYIRSRVEAVGIHDDSDLRLIQQSIGRTEEQIVESLRTVHEAIEASAATGEGW